MFLLEVNPRASRTVPFLSKVTGVPMVELATRIALGATLEALGWPARRTTPAAALYGRQGPRLVGREAARRGSHPGPRDALYGRSDRDPPGPARGGAKFASGGGAASAAARAPTARSCSCRWPTATSRAWSSSPPRCRLLATGSRRPTAPWLPCVPRATPFARSGGWGRTGTRDPDILAAITLGAVALRGDGALVRVGRSAARWTDSPDDGGRGAPLLHHHRDGHRGRALARSPVVAAWSAAPRRVAGHDGEGGIRGGRRRARSRVTPNHPAEQLQSVLAGRQRHQQQGRKALGSVRRPQRWMSSGGAAPRDHGRRPHAMAGEPAVKRRDDMTSRAPSGFEAEVGLNGQRVPLPPSLRDNSPRFGPPRSTRGRPGSFSAFLPHRPAELDGCHRRSRRP